MNFTVTYCGWINPWRLFRFRMKQPALSCAMQCHILDEAFEKVPSSHSFSDAPTEGCCTLHAWVGACSVRTIKRQSPGHVWSLGWCAHMRDTRHEAESDGVRELKREKEELCGCVCIDGSNSSLDLILSIRDFRHKARCSAFIHQFSFSYSRMAHMSRFWWL